MRVVASAHGAVANRGSILNRLCGQLSCVEASALLGHLFVLVPIPAFLAGLARRDVSLDGRSAAISRPIASPHGRARWGEHDLAGYATRDLFRPKAGPVGQSSDVAHNWTEAFGVDASSQLRQLFTVRFDDEEQAVHVGALGIGCLDDRDNRAAGSKHWPGAVEDISADEVEHDVHPCHVVQRVVSKVEILLCPQL